MNYPDLYGEHEGMQKGQTNTEVQKRCDHVNLAHSGKVAPRLGSDHEPPQSVHQVQCREELVLSVDSCKFNPETHCRISQTPQ